MLTAVALVLATSSAAHAGRSSVSRCASRATVRGIDVSKWQGKIDWEAVRAHGVRFAFIRVSDGHDRVDPRFARNWKEARRVGIVRGAYQYFRPRQDPVKQADLLLAAMGAPRKGDLPPVIDVEVSDGVAPRELLRRLDRWIQRVKRATGMTPIVYTSAKSWLTLARNSRRFRKHALWVAHYGVKCPKTPTAWSSWTFHQFSQTGRVAGVDGPVDENRFRGTLAALRRTTLKNERMALKRWKRWRQVADADRRRSKAATRRVAAKAGKRRR